jgi:hypothetical protein
VIGVLGRGKQNARKVPTRFQERGINNSLPCVVVESTSVSRFKASLADFLGDVLFEF